ncbi:MAG: flagellar basal body P-ring protein FlgI [Burkholderiaceae bacterium]|jgi:flagellar P-ring protein precursor FlgI|nr:flagellar basal body P-ring protein FlgI [Betaproteobacteria bacterium]
MHKFLINFKRSSLLVLTALLMTGQFLFLSQAAAQQRIKEIAAVAGERSNQLIGYGLVVGLDGSGDQTTQSPFTLQSTLAMLQSLGVAIPPGVSAQTRNIAAVMVTSELPALARPGQKIDLTISSIGNAKSLRGGTLLMTPLRGADGQIYALAQGSIFVGGAGASAGGSSATVNHLSVGRITGGGLIERALPTQAVGEFVQLDLYQSDYSLMRRVAEAIAKRFGAGVALPQDARTMRVAVPVDPLTRIAFMSDLENLTVTGGGDRAKVVVNARTGSVVMNQAVKLLPSAVAHGNLSVKIQSEASVSQPEPFSRGQTAVTNDAQVQIEQGGVEGGLVRVPPGATLDDVVRALNILGAKPADLMAILQALKASGALQADLEVI